MAKYWYTNVQHAEAYVQRHLFIYFKLAQFFEKNDIFCLQFFF